MFGLAYIDIAIIVVLYMVFVFFIKGVAISRLSSQRDLCTGVYPYLLVFQDYVLGNIADDINIFGGKYSEWFVHLLCLSATSKIMLGIAIYNRISLLGILIFLALFLALHYFRLRVNYTIYKDYAPNHATLFIVLSIFMNIDYLLLFAIKNNVPVSMSFQKQDEWQFQVNRAGLQRLWDEYHASDVQCTWGEYLMMRNFVPVHSSMVNYNNFF